MTKNLNFSSFFFFQLCDSIAHRQIAGGLGLQDVALMLQTIGDKPMAMLPAIAARMDQLIAAGHGARDASALAIDSVAPK